MKICLQGMVSNAKADVKNRCNIPLVQSTLEGMQDIIVGLLKGDITHKEAEEFLFNSNNRLEDAKYYNSIRS